VSPEGGVKMKKESGQKNFSALVFVIFFQGVEKIFFSEKYFSENFFF